MQNRDQQDSQLDLNPPHTRPLKILDRYQEELMRLTYENPLLVRNLIKVVGVSSLALLAAPVLSYFFGFDMPLGWGIASAAAGAVGAAASRFSWFMQNKFYGMPVDEGDKLYQSGKYEYHTARGELSVDHVNMPRLQITAENPYDAGYVEGYMLGHAIRSSIISTKFLYRLMWWMGAPLQKSNLQLYFDKILEHIPEKYQLEVRGKVDGYNRWLHENGHIGEDLGLHYYYLMQLLPDILNYNPFNKNEEATIEPPGCTTIALRLGDYTFITRVLDWPAYNVAGKSFIQIDRNITGSKRIIDVGIPLLSGALTVLNQDGLLIEMNVSHGERVDVPSGMPAVFFNRFCAENAKNVADIEALLAEHQPLGAYHLTASDGVQTQSFHFYQHEDKPGEHAIDKLPVEKDKPQLLVVANHGLQYQNDQSVKTSHRESDERKQNIHHLFFQKSAQQKFAGYIDKQQRNEKLSPEDIVDIKEFCLQVARLPLISNCRSVLCALYVYHHDELIDASAATDNLYAQKRYLSEFKRLTVPG